MFAIIDSTIIKQKGFISLFKTFKFKIIIRDAASLEHFIEELSLKSKTSFVGHIFEIPNATKKLLFEIVYENRAENYFLDVKEGNESIKIDRSKFKGVINIKFTNENLFLDLENKELIKRGLQPIKNLSKQIALNKERIATRITYDNKIYYVDLQNNKSYWEKENQIFSDDLPKGWERRFTAENKIFYVNHNKNTTQWENPNSKNFIAELENKMLQYRILSEGLNFFNIFDLSKFKIVVNRNFIVQSTAPLFINAKRDELIRQPFVIFIGEMGEDYGAIVKEFFYEGSLEIIKDERIKHISGVFDVNTMQERNSNQENAREVEIHKKAKDIIHDQVSQEQNISTPEPNLFDMLLNVQPMSNTHQNQELINYFENEEVNLNENKPTENNLHKNKLSDKDFFTYLGIFIGLAFEHEINIGVDFSLAFYENLLQRKFVISQIQDVQVQSSLNYILSNPLEEGILYDDDGNTINEEDKLDYVHKSIVNILYESKKQEYDWVRDGFYRIAIPQIVDLFSTGDISKILSGKEELTFDMIREAVIYFNCAEETKEVQFLWNILKRKDEDFYRKFLQFLTGSASVPLGGLRSKKFKWFIEVVNEYKMFVRASACLNKLYIGHYDTEDQMEYILVYSIENTEGFHKV